MGKYDLAIKLGENLLNSTAKYVKACGKRSILETKPTIFHGINPTATYPPSGKTFALPRFCTQEMQEARRMNKIAIHQAKAQGIERTYPKAAPKDLKRLTSETIEDSYSRVEWTNPKDGKVYNLLKQGETEDGKVIVRILDEQGAFVKEAELAPDKIIIIDDFTNKRWDLYNCSHGEIVEVYAKRHNPFAKIEIINKEQLLPPSAEYNKIFQNIETRIKNGEKIDFISCSHGNTCFTTTKNMKGKMSEMYALPEIKSDRPRLIYSAGNEGAEATSKELLIEGKIEGVGSLSQKSGQISDFSASRNSYFTQHYEIGEYNIRPTRFGANITGISGTDINFNTPNYIKYIKNNPIIGKSKERTDKIHKKIEKEYYEILDKKSEMFREKNIDFKVLSKLEERQSILARRLNKLNDWKNSTVEKDGNYECTLSFNGTSFSAPVRTAKLALNDMMKDVL